MISLSSLATGKEKERERKRGNGLTDFTVFSSILDTFFFNGKGERDYQTSGCETSVPDPNTFWATERELLIHELEPQFHFPSPEASCTGLLLYLVGSATWAHSPNTTDIYTQINIAHIKMLTHSSHSAHILQKTIQCKSTSQLPQALIPRRVHARPAPPSPVQRPHIASHHS